MIYIFLVFFILLFIIEYRVQKNFIAPVSLILAAFIMALGLIAWNVNNWEVKLNSTFILYSIVGAISFAIGAVIVEGSAKKLSVGVSLNTPKTEVTLSVIRLTSILFLLLSLFCTSVYAFLLFRQVGYHGGAGETLQAIYSFKLSNSSNFLVHQMLEIVVAASKVSLFEGFLLFYFHKGKDKFLSLSVIGIQVVMFAICSVLSTDRNIILRFFIYTLILWILFESSSNSVYNRRKADIKIFVKASVFIFVVALLFFALGKARNATSDFERMIGIYGGSGLYNFNLFVLKDRDYLFGQSTFRTVINNLQSFGLLEGKASDAILVDNLIAFKSSNGYVFSSNIYSSLRGFWEDFGMIGIIVLSLLMGGVFEFFYLFVKKKSYGFAWIFYALTAYSIIYYVIDEQFYRILHLGIIYEIGWVAFFYLVVKFFEKINVGEKKRSSTTKGIANEL